MAILREEEIHYCKVMNYSQERALKVLEKASMLAMFGGLTEADERFLEFCKTPEIKSEPVSFLTGNEFATDYVMNGITCTRLNFEDEYGERHLWTTNSFSESQIDFENKQEIQSCERINSEKGLQPSPEILVDFDTVFFNMKNWVSKEALKEMVKQTIVLPDSKVLDNGHCKATFRPKVVRMSGHYEYIPEDNHKGFNRGKTYTGARAYLAITWIYVEGTLEVYAPKIPVLQSYTVSTRTFEQLTEKEKASMNRILNACFME